MGDGTMAPGTEAAVELFMLSPGNCEKLRQLSKRQHYNALYVSCPFSPYKLIPIS